MCRFKSWVINKYLPAYARASIYDEIRKLTADAEALKQAIKEQQAVIAALKYALKCGRLLEIQLKGVDVNEYMERCPDAGKSDS